MIIEDDGHLSLIDTATWKPTSEIYTGSAESVIWLPNGSFLTTSPFGPRATAAVQIWTRHRPEAWYGVAVLPQFWLALCATLFTLARIRADLRRWYHPTLTTPEPPAGMEPEK